MLMAGETFTLAHIMRLRRLPDNVKTVADAREVDRLLTLLPDVYKLDGKLLSTSQKEFVGKLLYTVVVCGMLDTTPILSLCGIGLESTLETPDEEPQRCMWD